MNDSPPKDSLVAVAKNLKEAYDAKVVVQSDRQMNEQAFIIPPQGDSPSSHEAQTCSSEVPPNLRNLLQAKPEHKHTSRHSQHYPCEGYTHTQMASERLSPKDVIIKAGKRKRQEALYTAFTAEKHKADSNGQLYNVNFVGSSPQQR